MPSTKNPKNTSPATASFAAAKASSPPSEKTRNSRSLGRKKPIRSAPPLTAPRFARTPPAFSCTPCGASPPGSTTPASPSYSSFPSASSNGSPSVKKTPVPFNLASTSLLGPRSTLSSSTPPPASRHVPSYSPPSSSSSPQASSEINCPQKISRPYSPGPFGGAAWSG